MHTLHQPAPISSAAQKTAVSDKKPLRSLGDGGRASRQWALESNALTEEWLALEASHTRQEGLNGPKDTSLLLENTAQRTIGGHPPCTGWSATHLTLSEWGCPPHLTCEGAEAQGRAMKLPQQPTHGRTGSESNSIPLRSSPTLPRGPRTQQNSKHTGTKNSKKTALEVNADRYQVDSPKESEKLLTSIQRPLHEVCRPKPF